MKCFSEEPDAGLVDGQACRPGKHLDHRHILANFQDTPATQVPLPVPDFHDFIVADVGRAFHDYDRTFYAANTDNFLAA